MTTKLNPRRVTTFGYMLVPDDLSEELSAALSQQASELEEIYHSAISQVKKIDSSDTYTARGKARQKQKLMAELEKDLEQFYRQATKPMMFQHGPSLALEMERLRSELEPRQTGEDPVLTHLRHREIRDLLRRMEPTQREAAVRSEAARGNYAYLEAVLSAPEDTSHYILELTKKDLVEKRITSTNPEAWARITQLDLAQGRMLGMLKTFKQALAKQGIESPEEPEQTTDAVALMAQSG